MTVTQSMSLFVVFIAYQSTVVLAEPDDARRFAKCAAIEAPLERLECFDDVADEFGLTEPKTSSETIGRWTVKTEISPIDDSKNVYLSVDGDSVVNGWLDTHRPSLVLRCKESELSARIATGMIAHTEAVTLRLDKEKAYTETMSESTNREALFFRKPLDLIGKLLQHNRLLFQFTPHNASPALTTFQLAGLGEALRPLKEACNLVLTREEAIAAVEKASGPIHAGRDGVTFPVVIHKVQPEYPKLARLARIDGRVIMQIVVRKDGTVDNPEILSCSREDIGFEEAAIEAVKKWRYEPATWHGEPVDVYFTIRTEFELQ